MIFVLTTEPDGDGFLPVQAVPLIVEIVESGLSLFMHDKLNCYAKHKVPEYWVVDVNDRTIYQMWSSIDGAYAQQRTIAFGSPITAATIPGLIVETTTL